MNRQRGCRRLSTLIATPQDSEPELAACTTTWYRTRDRPTLIHPLFAEQGLSR